MRITIIGAGRVGGTLGRRWAEAGHEVTFAVRRPAEGTAAVKGGDALPHGARVASPADAVRGAEVVVVATPAGVVRDALLEAGAAEGALDGVALFDATNPIGPGLRVLVGENGGSGGEQVQALIPRARVVKVFNTTGYENMADPTYQSAPTVMFYAGNDAAAKATAHRLAEDLGFEPVDAGPLSRAHELEHLAVLWISLSMGALGRNFAFQVVRR